MIRLSHAARRDLRAILDYLEQESQGLSIRRRFLAAFYESCEIHERWHDLGKRLDINVSRHRNIRRLQFAGSSNISFFTAASKAASL